MNCLFTNFPNPFKISFLLLLLSVLSSFQGVNAQHCFPSFHFSIEANTVAFADQSTADGDITAYSWNFGDGSTSTEQNPSHAYSTPGTYNVCLTITAHDPNCTETYCHHVVVTHPPANICHAAFVAHQTDPAQTTVVFTDQSTSDGTISSWAWDFGDGHTSTEENPSHTYTEPGTYLVCLTTTDENGGCTNHICHHVVVHHPPAVVCHAAFVAHQPDPTQTTIVFTDQSTSDGTIGSWTWDFGDGHTSTEQNPSHTYTEPGSYQVCLIVTAANGGCTSHVCHQVVVHHAPAADCQASFTVHYSSSLDIQFANISTGTTDHTTYSWEFGDGVTSNEENPLHTYAHSGHYTVCLFIHDTITGCSSHVCHSINVHHGGIHHYHPHHAHLGSKANLQSKPRANLAGPSSVELINYPNPFAGSTTVVYNIPVESTVKFEVYSVTGVLVADFAQGNKPAGEYSETLTIENLQPGLYFLKMILDGTPYVRQIMLMD